MITKRSKVVFVNVVAVIFIMLATSIFTVQAAPAGDPDPLCGTITGLVACWRMEGNWLDGSGNELNGNLNTGGTTSWVTGRVGNSAFDFNGSTYAAVSDNNLLDLTNITIAVWVKPISYALQDLLTKVSSNSGYVLFLSGSRGTPPRTASFKVFGNTSYQINTTDNEYPIDGTWTHLAASYDGITTTMKIYFNGNPIEAKTIYDTPGTNAIDLNIGGLAGATHYYSGAMDDLRIYSRALSGDEIKWILGDPTAVNLNNFTGTSSANFVNVRWETANEVDLQGFNLYRSTKPSDDFVKINSVLISSTYPGQIFGASYQYLDTVTPGLTYYYRLELVKDNGIWPGPILAVEAGNWIHLPMIMAITR